MRTALLVTALLVGPIASQNALLRRGGDLHAVRPASASLSATLQRLVDGPPSGRASERHHDRHPHRNHGPGIAVAGRSVTVTLGHRFLPEGKRPALVEEAIEQVVKTVLRAGPYDTVHLRVADGTGRHARADRRAGRTDPTDPEGATAGLRVRRPGRAQRQDDRRVAGPRLLLALLARVDDATPLDRRADRGHPQRRDRQPLSHPSAREHGGPGDLVPGSAARCGSRRSPTTTTGRPRTGRPGSGCRSTGAATAAGPTAWRSPRPRRARPRPGRCRSPATASTRCTCCSRPSAGWRRASGTPSITPVGRRR